MNYLHRAFCTAHRCTESLFALQRFRGGTNRNLYHKSTAQRRFSSNKDYKKSYLDNWANTGPSKKSNTNAPSSVNSRHMNMNPLSPQLQTPLSSPLQVMGSSYLLPTLRLPRNTTSSSLSASLSSFLDGANNHAMKSMLQPSKTTSSKHKQYRIPIILDLSAFQHDGSPHYIPPPIGFLSGVIETLDQWGITVMGVSNVQTVENVSQEMDALALPVLGRVGSGRTLGNKGKGLGGSTSATNDSGSVGVEELVQLVLKKMEDENEHEDYVKEYEHDEEGEHEDGHELEEQVQVHVVPREEILQLSFRELQRDCKALEITAVGTTAVLQGRLLEYYGHDELIHEDEDDDDEDGQEEGDAEHLEEHSNANASMNNSITMDTDTLVHEMSPNIVRAAKVYHGSVRSGQQVSTDEPNQSLIIMGNVNSGGEVMADRDIYVFGSLRGRALAGLGDNSTSTSSGDEKHNDDISACANISIDSKIICSHFDAELICIGETFTTVDSMEAVGLKEGSAAMITCSISSEDGHGHGILNFVGF